MNHQVYMQKSRKWRRKQTQKKQVGESPQARKRMHGGKALARGSSELMQSVGTEEPTPVRSYLGKT